MCVCVCVRVCVCVCVCVCARGRKKKLNGGQAEAESIVYCGSHVFTIEIQHYSPVGWSARRIAPTAPLERADIGVLIVAAQIELYTCKGIMRARVYVYVYVS